MTCMKYKQNTFLELTFMCAQSFLVCMHSFEGTLIRTEVGCFFPQFKSLITVFISGGLNLFNFPNTSNIINKSSAQLMHTSHHKPKNCIYFDKKKKFFFFFFY